MRHRDATVSSVAPFGCIVDYSPGEVGLVHVSELNVSRMVDPAATWKAGDKVDVKILECDNSLSRCKVSRCACVVCSCADHIMCAFVMQCIVAIHAHTCTFAGHAEDEKPM